MNMEVRILHLGNVKFEAITRGHRVMCDQPPANGGSIGLFAASEAKAENEWRFLDIVVVENE